MTADPRAPLAPSDAGLFSGRPLTRSERVAVALLVGVAAGLAAFVIMSMHPEMAAKDFTQTWRGAGALLRGQNPYEVRLFGTYPFNEGLYYPLPAVIAAIPVAGLPAPAAGATLVGAGAGALAYAVSREGLWRLWMFLSAPFLMAVALGQWSPLLIAGVLLTPLGWVLACKPTIGAALFTYRPSWRVFALGAALTAVSFLVLPNWVSGWLHSVSQAPHHSAPLLRPFGFLALAALVRWRTAEGRLVAAMACVPQVMYFYEQLPLMLVARDGRSAFALTALSWLAYLGTRVTCSDQYFCGPQAVPWVTWGIYVPATVLVLVRPGVPDAPWERLRALAWWGRRPRSA